MLLDAISGRHFLRRRVRIVLEASTESEWVVATLETLGGGDRRRDGRGASGGMRTTVADVSRAAATDRRNEEQPLRARQR